MTDALSSPEKWAAGTLGLPEGTGEVTTRATFLEELAREGFVPPLQRQIAWKTFLAPHATLPDAARRAAEVRLRGEIDDFAAEFFALSPAERSRQWQALSERAAVTAPLAARLAALEPGLTVVVPSEGDPKVVRLAAAVSSLFVLAPLARSAQRQALLNGMKEHMGVWEGAAQSLRKSAPALAALDPQLLDAIKSWRKLQARLAQARAGARPRVRTTAKAAAPAPASSSGLSGRALIWIAFVVIGVGAKVCSGIGGSSHPAPPPPRFEPPRFQPVDFQKNDEWRKILEDAQRQNEEERQRERNRQKWEDAPDPFPPVEAPGRVKGIGTAADEKPRRP